MSDTFFYQCRLKKVVAGEVSHEVCWLPEKYAQKGRVVKIKQNGAWSDGWTVINVWSKKTREEIMERSRDYLHQRDFSDL